MQMDDSHAACGPPFVSHSCRRVGPQHGRGDVEAGLPHPASALRPSRLPTARASALLRRGTGTVAAVSQYPVRARGCASGFQSTSRAPPERQARLLVRPGSEPLPRDQTFLLLSREPAESCTAGQTDARAYIQGPWPTSTQTPSLRRTARVSPAVPVAFSPRAEGPDDAMWQPEASRHSNVSSSTGANAADVPAVYRSGRACPC